MNCSLPDFSVHGISQARMEWVAIAVTKGSSQPKDQTHVSYTGRWIFYHWATRETQPHAASGYHITPVQRG